MPLYNPPVISEGSGLSVDAQGFVTVPNDPDAIPFKITKEALPDGPPHIYVITVNDGGTVKDVVRQEI